MCLKGVRVGSRCCFTESRGQLDVGNRVRELSVSVPKSKTWLSMLAQSKADRFGLNLVESLDAAQISSNGEDGDGDLD